MLAHKKSDLGWNVALNIPIQSDPSNQRDGNLKRVATPAIIGVVDNATPTALE